MTQTKLTDAEIDGLSGRGRLLLQERAVTVGKSGSNAIVACDNGDDATAVWAYLESLGKESTFDKAVEACEAERAQRAFKRAGRV